MQLLAGTVRCRVCPAFRSPGMLGHSDAGGEEACSAFHELLYQLELEHERDVCKRLEQLRWELQGDAMPQVGQESHDVPLSRGPSLRSIAGLPHLNNGSILLGKHEMPKIALKSQVPSKPDEIGYRNDDISDSGLSSRGMAYGQEQPNGSSQSHSEEPRASTSDGGFRLRAPQALASPVHRQSSNSIRSVQFVDESGTDKQWTDGDVNSDQAKWSPGGRVSETLAPSSRPSLDLDTMQTLCRGQSANSLRRSSMYGQVTKKIAEEKQKKKSGASSEFGILKGWKEVPGRMQSSTNGEPGILHCIVTSQVFDVCCSIAIMLNCISLGVATDYSARHGNPNDVPGILQLTDVMFTCWFTTELLLRIAAAGAVRFVSSPQWSWNVFDMFVVGSDLLNTMIDILWAGDSGSRQNLTAVRMLRVLRIVRAVRVVRLLRFFRELRMMVFSIMRSGTALFWSIVLLFIIVYIFGVYLTSNVTYYLVSDLALVDDDADTLRNDFGSLVSAVWTLYQCVSGGTNWGLVAAPLIGIHWSNGLVLSFFVFFTMTAMMNIVTGIFVEEAIHSANTDREESIQDQIHSETSAMRHIQQIFEEADHDGSNEITLEELDDHLSNPRVRAHLNSMGMEVNEAHGLFQLLDMDKSGTITIEEFVYGCMRLKGGAKSLDLATLMYENKRMAQMWHEFFKFVQTEFQAQREFEDSLLNTLNIDRMNL